ncbi:MAG: hypothetical protein C0507_24015 [Cyanobacteria bacterium PR.3.49]|nr:hypothetical protein [Cyanobacteria bacterium PR.3.49]
MTEVAARQQPVDKLAPLKDGGRSVEQNQTLINEVNDEYRNNGLSRGAGDYQSAVDTLRTNGVLPNLMISELGRINTDRDPSKISESEINRIINMGRNVPFLTAVAARGLRGALRDMDVAAVNPNTGEREIDVNRFLAHWRAKQADVRAGGNQPGERRETPAGPLPPAEAQPRRSGRLNEDLVGRDGETQTPEQRAKQVQLDKLQSGTGTFQERLAAVKELHKLGVTSFDMVDSNGERIKARIQVSKINGNTNAVYLHGQPERGREQVMLRGIERNGNFEQQRNRDGSAATYAGTLWSKTRPTSVLTRDNTPPPPVPLPRPRPNS